MTLEDRVHCMKCHWSNFIVWTKRPVNKTTGETLYFCPQCASLLATQLKGAEIVLKSENAIIPMKPEYL